MKYVYYFLIFAALMAVGIALVSGEVKTFEVPTGLIVALSFGLVATSALVMVLAVFVAVTRMKTHKLDDVFWFAVALLIGWAVTFYFRLAYIGGTYNWIGHTYLMEEGPDASVAFGLFLVIVSGLLHIRALTWREDLKLWRWMSLLVFAITTGTLWWLP